MTPKRSMPTASNSITCRSSPSIPRRGTKKPSQLPKVFPDQPTPQLTWAQQDRFKTRTMIERVNARLKDEFGASQIRVRGPVKIMAHLMFGVLALTVDQWLRMSVPT